MTSQFYFHSNQLTSSLPSQLGAMSKLEQSFYMYSNSLSGSLPSEFGKLSLMISDFDMSSNSLRGSLPSELGQLINITEAFILKSNLFCDDIPSEVAALSSGLNVVADWSTDVLTANSFGTLCCLSLPAIYSCAPTPQPTLTLPPTPLPSLPPSPQPSPIPTSRPSPSPSSVPTLYCKAGTYVDSNAASIVCIDCPIGKYSTVESAPFASSCTLCQVGKYSTVIGSSSCIDCAIGKLSSADRTFCEDCSAGQYNYNNTECVSCEYGKYAPQALTDSCLDCEAGSQTNNITKATTCTKCDSGKYSLGTTSVCLECPRGKYSLTGQSTCLECEAGKYAASNASTTCQACSVGYSSLASSYQCDLAATGYYLSYPNYEALECPNHADCIGGTYGPIPDQGYYVDRSQYRYAGILFKCARKTCSISGKYQEKESCWKLDHYEDNNTHTNLRVKCDSDAIQCKHGSSGPICGSCEVGYVYSGITNDCSTCQSAQLVSYIAVGSLLFMGLIIFMTSASYLFRSSSSSSSLGVSPTMIQMIRNNYIVRLLSNLESGSLKVMWVSYQIIVSSSFTLGITYPTPFSSMLSVFSIFSLDFLALECLTSGKQAYFDTVYLWCLFPLCLAALIVISGIIRYLCFSSSSKFNSNQEQNNSLLMSMTETSPSPQTTLYTSSREANGKSSGTIIQQMTEDKDEEDRDEESAINTRDLAKNSENFHRERIMNQHIWLLLFLSYIVLPAVSNKQLQVFDCIEINNHSYLRSDTGIDCEKSDYMAFKSMVTIFIILYQLIPISWFLLLYSQRDALHPGSRSNSSTSLHDEKLACYIRDNNPKLTSLRFLFTDYKCNKWWFEIIDMYRRILFIGIIPLVSPNSATRSSFGVILAIFSVAYFREEQPYRVDFTNVIAHVAQFSILTTFYSALSIESESLMNFGLRGNELGVFLLFTNLSVLALCFYLAWNNFQKQFEEINMREAKANASEDARHFSENKFVTTFESIWRHSIPPSHVLAFHYLSSSSGVKARRSGLKAHGKFNGVPFTLRYPYRTNKNDELVFNQDRSIAAKSSPLKEMIGKENVRTEPEHEEASNTFSSPTLPPSSSTSPTPSPPEIQETLTNKFPSEEVLVLSLPKHYLESLPGFESDAGLCMISADSLGAMRPTSYTAVIDSQPWLDGYCLLPPQSILRSFLLRDSLQEVVGSSSEGWRPSSAGGALSSYIRASNSNVVNGEEGGEIVNSDDISDGAANGAGGVGMARSINSKQYSSFSSTANSSKLRDRLNSKISKQSSSQYSKSEEEYVKDISMKLITKIHDIDNIESYKRAMSVMRDNAEKINLVPLFHYTSLEVAPLILKYGLRMSTQGQGDGGVYFSTLGPASYGLGTHFYEENIIKDCYGVERLHEYIGQGKLDVIIVYGCVSTLLQQAPGGRDNAKMISKTTFSGLSLENRDGNYFLRPDRILGCFHVNHSQRLSNVTVTNQFQSLDELEIEKNRERQVIEKLIEQENDGRVNINRIDNMVTSVWPMSSIPETSIDTQSRISMDVLRNRQGDNFSQLSASGGGGVSSFPLDHINYIGQSALSMMTPRNASKSLSFESNLVPFHSTSSSADSLNESSMEMVAKRKTYTSQNTSLQNTSHQSNHPPSLIGSPVILESFDEEKMFGSHEMFENPLKRTSYPLKGDARQDGASEI